MSKDSAANAPAPSEEAPALSESAPNAGNAEIAKTDKSDAIAEPKEGDKKTSEEVDDKNKTEDSAKNGADAAEPDKSADDVDMKDSTQETAPGASAAEKEKPSSAEKEQEDEGAATNAGAAQAATPAADKNKSRRKSAGAPGSQTKKLNKKASKAKLTHIEAQPGDYFFVKLKGHPQWPVVICDEDMLPQTLIKSRPVTAARQDGTYREDYADGGKRAHERTFPVMYLYTNEFSWVRNTDFSLLDASTVMEAINDKMRKDLRQAYEIASNALPLDHFKDILQQFQEDLAEKIKTVAEVVATPKKTSKKAKAAAAEEDQDEDMEMPDADEEEAEKPKKSSKKRKAEEDAAPPQESAKKTKIKITSNSTPKAANGAATPKSTKATEQKSAKPKSKPKSKGEDKNPKAEVQQKEPELSAEEKHQRKEKEVLFLRHKLQKGLLARDEEPKEEEMKTMSEYVSKLEIFPDLEVDIIRKTKINKVLKAILKLGSIPKESEFKFKDRSQSLLEKWNKLLAEESTPVNGVNGKLAEPDASKGDAEHSEKTNGNKANGVAEEESSKAASKSAEGSDAAPEAVETEA